MKAQTLSGLAADLRDRKTTSRELVEQCLSRIKAGSDEGDPTFLLVDAETSLHTADAMDRLRAHSIAPSAYAGIPISVKDLFDIVGEKTTAGSRVLSDAPHSQKDCEAVYRLRRAGFVVIGRTNMTEFAYSGLGLNPHFGTPSNPLAGFANCIPGGSSSGAAVSVARGYAFAGLATDTGGSARIPAAFCNLVGYKPTARRVSLDGMVPLSTTLDSVGWIARSVSCIKIFDSILSAENLRVRDNKNALKLTIGIPRNVIFDDCEPEILVAFDRVRNFLARSGVQCVDIDLPELEEVGSLLVDGGIAAAESYAWHHELIKERHSAYDPRVLRQIEMGAGQSASDYINTVSLRNTMIERFNGRLDGLDAIAFPTVAVRPPRFAELSADRDYDRLNRLILRNTMTANLLDGCAISLPVPNADGIGFMLMAATNQDAHLLFISNWVENILRTAGQEGLPSL